MWTFFHFVIIEPHIGITSRMQTSHKHTIIMYFPSNILEVRTRRRHQVQIAPHAENMVSSKVFQRILFITVHPFITKI
jgi:hypothetical protein